MNVIVLVTFSSYVIGNCNDGIVDVVITTPVSLFIHAMDHSLSLILLYLRY